MNLDLEVQLGYAQDQVPSLFLRPHLDISVALGELPRENSVCELSTELAIDSATDVARDALGLLASGDRCPIEVLIEVEGSISAVKSTALMQVPRKCG